MGDDSMDLRERTVRAVEVYGLSRHAAAARFGLGVSTVINWVRRRRETGSLRPGQMGAHKPRKIAGDHRLWLVVRCREGPSRCAVWWPSWASRWMTARYGTLSMPRRSVTKKDAGRQRTGPSRRRATARAMAELSAQDRALAAGLHRRDLDQDHHGAAPRLGAHGSASAGHGAVRTLEHDDLVATLHRDRVEAPWLLDRPIVASASRPISNRCSCRPSPGDIVIMDNLGAHKAKAVRAASRHAGPSSSSGRNTPRT